MPEGVKPRGRPARPKDDGDRTDTRMAKCLRVLAVLQGRTGLPEGVCLNRGRLADAAGVTVRNLDAILRSLREQGHDIRHDESRGYWMETPAPTDFRVRTPEAYRSLRSLRDFVRSHEELVERDRWVRILDDILSSSEEARRKNMGRGFEAARIDSDGRVYRVSEPEILYLNVHRPQPDQLTKSHVSNLREAIRDCHPVRMTYVDREGILDAVQVEPYFLFHREGTFYLGGLQTHAGGRPLKSARFKPFTITAMRCRGLDVLRDRTFERQERFEAGKRLTRTGIRGTDGEASVEAEFEVFGRFAYNACETDHGEGSKVEWLSTGPRAQHLRIRATFGSLYDLVKYLLSFGEFAVVNRPESVRSIIVDNIRGMARRYGLPVQEPAPGEEKGKPPRGRRPSGRKPQGP